MKQTRKYVIAYMLCFLLFCAFSVYGSGFTFSPTGHYVPSECAICAKTVHVWEEYSQRGGDCFLAESGKSLIPVGAEIAQRFHTPPAIDCVVCEVCRARYEGEIDKAVHGIMARARVENERIRGENEAQRKAEIIQAKEKELRRIERELKAMKGKS